MDRQSFMALAEEISQFTVQIIRAKISSLITDMPKSTNLILQDIFAQGPRDVLEKLQLSEPNKNENLQIIELDSILSDIRNQTKQLSLALNFQRYNSLVTNQQRQDKPILQQSDIQTQASLKSPQDDVLKPRTHRSEQFPSKLQSLTIGKLDSQQVQSGLKIIETPQEICLSESSESVLNSKISKLTSPKFSKSFNKVRKIPSKLDFPSLSNELGQLVQDLETFKSSNVLTRMKLPKKVFDDGSSYDGEWIGQQRDGFGVEIFFDGIKYQGQYQNDEFHGHGLLEYPDGRRYEGMFQNGFRHGQGEERNSDGVIYIGQWDKGLKNGVFNVKRPLVSNLFYEAASAKNSQTKTLGKSLVSTDCNTPQFGFRTFTEDSNNSKSNGIFRDNIHQFDDSSRIRNTPTRKDDSKQDIPVVRRHAFYDVISQSPRTQKIADQLYLIKDDN